MAFEKGEDDNRQRSNKGQRDGRPRLGQILMESGIIDTAVLHDCLRKAKRTHRQIGDILVTEGKITPEILTSALLTQNLIADGVLGERAGVKALRLACTKGISLVNAIENLDPSDAGDQIAVSQLPEILVESGLLSAAELGEMQGMAQTSGISLTKALLVSRTLTVTNLDAILSSILHIRNGTITKADAVKAISNTVHKKVEVGRTTVRLPCFTNAESPTLGKLLVESKCLSDFECLVARENALATNRKLGEVLVQTGLLSEALLAEALLLQQFIARGIIQTSQAAEALQQIDKDGSNLSSYAQNTLIFKDDPQSRAALELLIKVGALTSDAISQSLNAQAKFKMDPARALLASGKVSKSLLGSAHDCVARIEQGSLTAAQAIKVLEQVKDGQTEFERAVENARADEPVAPKNNKVEVHTEIQNTGNQKLLAGLVSRTELRLVLAVIAALSLLELVIHQNLPKNIGIFGDIFVVLIVIVGTTLLVRRKGERKLEKTVSVENARATAARLKAIKRP